MLYPGLQVCNRKRTYYIDGGKTRINEKKGSCTVRKSMATTKVDERELKREVKF